MILWKLRTNCGISGRGNFDESASSGVAAGAGGGSSIASLEGVARVVSTMLTAFLSTAEGNPVRLANTTSKFLEICKLILHLKGDRRWQGRLKTSFFSPLVTWQKCWTMPRPKLMEIHIIQS